MLSWVTRARVLLFGYFFEIVERFRRTHSKWKHHFLWNGSWIILNRLLRRCILTWRIVHFSGKSIASNLRLPDISFLRPEFDLHRGSESRAVRRFETNFASRGLTLTLSYNGLSIRAEMSILEWVFLDENLPLAFRVLWSHKLIAFFSQINGSTFRDTFKSLSGYLASRHDLTGGLISLHIS